MITLQKGVRYSAAEYLVANKHLLEKYDTIADLIRHVQRETGSTVDDTTIGTLCYAIILMRKK